MSILYKTPKIVNNCPSSVVDPGIPQTNPHLVSANHQRSIPATRFVEHICLYLRAPQIVLMHC